MIHASNSVRKGGKEKRTRTGLHQALSQAGPFLEKKIHMEVDDLEIPLTPPWICFVCH
jgi:hypothetical protein